MPQLNLPGTSPKEHVEDMTFSLPQPEPIKGFPELRWAGKRPFTSTHYFPAQLKEQYGDPVKGWMNRIYWGDNLQVMSHLLKEFRGKVDLVYIDPPFDSKADYKKTISIKSKRADSNLTNFEEKQYADIWTNDTYLQFLYERIIIIKELLSEVGCLYLHCDWHRSHLIRCLLDEVFGTNNFVNEIIWKRSGVHASTQGFGPVHDTIFSYSKRKNFIWNKQYSEYDDEYKEKWFSKVDKDGRKYGLVIFSAPGDREGTKAHYQINGNFPPFGRHWSLTEDKFNELKKNGLIEFSSNGTPYVKKYLDESLGIPVNDIWTDTGHIKSLSIENANYPTQKPEALLERIILASSNPGSIVLDCFMGSGTTQAVAMKLGRRFIGADINLGAIQTTTKRLNGIIQEKRAEQRSLLAADDPLYLNFQVYNVNNYDVFRNPVQARELLLQALEIDPLDTTDVFDGRKDGYRVKIMPVNRIATRADLNPIITGMNYRELDRQLESSPGAVLDRIMLVCMGHEPDLAAQLQMEIGRQYRIDVKVVDILREKERGLTFKYDSEADIVVEGKELVIRQFYPRNLLQKLSLLEENVEEWRELVETVAIDWNYNGEVLQPAIYDSPGKNDLVRGRYPIPEDHGIIRVKITDLLSESLETSLEVE